MNLEQENKRLNKIMVTLFITYFLTLGVLLLICLDKIETPQKEVREQVWFENPLTKEEVKLMIGKATTSCAEVVGTVREC